jgi:hypothetical protein
MTSVSRRFGGLRVFYVLASSFSTEASAAQSRSAFERRRVDGALIAASTLAQPHRGARLSRRWLFRSFDD